MDFPLEVILHALELSLAALPRPIILIPHPIIAITSENYRVLCSASLVCRQWRFPAQSLLLKTVIVVTSVGAVVLLDIVDRVRTLVIVGRNPPTTKSDGFIC